MRSGLRSNRHLGPFASLWSASASVAALNYLTNVLIVVYSPVDLYARYIVALSVLLLATQWSDGGLAGTINVLAAQDGSQRHLLPLYRKIGLKFASRIAVFAYCAALIVVVVLARFGKGAHGYANIAALAAFAFIGIVTSRATVLNALTYACGDFGRFNVSQVVPAAGRLALTGLLFATVRSPGLGMLMLANLVPAMLGLAMASRYSALSGTERVAGTPDEGEKEVDSRVRRFLVPSLFSTFMGAVPYNATLLGASLFTQRPAAIASYGVFQRLNQVIVMFVGPLNQYVSRELRLMGEWTPRRRKGINYICLGMGIYGAYSFIAWTSYSFLRLHFRHYSLDNPQEFMMFLAANGLGYLYTMLDSVLTTRGSAVHRVLGTVLFSSLTVLLIAFLRPTTLSLMIMIDILSVIAPVAYYVHLLATASQWHGGAEANARRA